jgi:hypothetical protein
MLTTSIERLEEIEQERLEVFADTSFQEWMKEFRVGRLATKPKDRASDMMDLWTNKHGIKNSFNQVINNLK